MAFKDKSLECIDCGAIFIFSASEQEFFQTKGFIYEPRHCFACRQAKRGERGLPSQIFHVVCAECGKETEVPFKPHKGKPVYCKGCYVKKKLVR